MLDTYFHQICILNNLSQLSTVLKLAYHLWTLEINIIPLHFTPSPYELWHHGAFCDTISIISKGLSQLQVHFDGFEFTICCVMHWLEGMVATEDFLLSSTPNLTQILGRFAATFSLYIQVPVEGNIINLHANNGSKCRGYFLGNEFKTPGGQPQRFETHLKHC